MEQPEAISLVEQIDRSPLSGRQILTLAMCAGVALLDGADTLSIGAAAPLIATEMSSRVTAFGTVFSAGLLGAAIGAMSFGPLADWLGRKRMLIFATVLFGAFTLLTAYAGSFESLVAIRFGAGCGLGGAAPCFISMASEYVPARLRKTLVSALWAAFPLGGMLGSILSSYLIASAGWRSIFYIGGALPLVLAAVIAAAMPESIQFLSLRRSAVEKVRSLVGDRSVVDPIVQLFSSGRAALTLLLWIPFFTAFATLAVVSFWTPALLYQQGIPASTGATVVACQAFGAVLGVLCGGHLVQRLGAGAVLSASFAIGAACAAALGFAVSSAVWAGAFMLLIGFFVGLAASGAIALSAVVYPTAMRSTGVGWALATGRFGQVLGPLAIGTLLEADWSAEGAMSVASIASVVGALAARALGGVAGAEERARIAG